MSTDKSCYVGRRRPHSEIVSVTHGKIKYYGARLSKEVVSVSEGRLNMLEEMSKGAIAVSKGSFNIVVRRCRREVFRCRRERLSMCESCQRRDFEVWQRTFKYV